MLRRFIIVLLALGIVPLFTGCESFIEYLEETEQSENPNSDNYKPRFAVGVFNIVRYPRALNLERQITSLDGRTVWINTNQGFSSKNLRDARWIARPGNPDVCDLQFKLTRMGKTQWQMLSGGRAGEEVALVIDGRYVGNFIPEIPEDDLNFEWVTLRVGIDHYNAKGVAKFAKNNYIYFNPDSRNWWSQFL